MILFELIYFIICLICAIIVAKKPNFDHRFMALICIFGFTPLLGIPFYRYMVH